MPGQFGAALQSCDAVAVQLSGDLAGSFFFVYFRIRSSFIFLSSIFSSTISSSSIFSSSIFLISPFFRFLYFQLCLHPFFFCQCFFHLLLLYFFTSIFSSSTFLLFPLLLPSSSVSNSLPLSIFCLRSFIGSDSQPVQHAMFNFFCQQSVKSCPTLILGSAMHVRRSASCSPGLDLPQNVGRHYVTGFSSVEL